MANIEKVFEAFLRIVERVFSAWPNRKHLEYLRNLRRHNQLLKVGTVIFVAVVVVKRSADPSSNPAHVYSFSVNFVFEKNEKNKKRPGLAYFLKTVIF